MENIKYELRGVKLRKPVEFEKNINRKYPEDAPTAIKYDQGNLLTGKGEILKYTM